MSHATKSSKPDEELLGWLPAPSACERKKIYWQQVQFVKDKILFATFGSYLVEQTLRNILKQLCLPACLLWVTSHCSWNPVSKYPAGLVAFVVQRVM